MKLVANDSVHLPRQDKSFASKALTGHGPTKRNRTDRIRQKSRSIRSIRQIAGWNEQLVSLVHSVETAWAAAERMRLAVEKYDAQTTQKKSR